MNSKQVFRIGHYNHIHAQNCRYVFVDATSSVLLGIKPSLRSAMQALALQSKEPLLRKMYEEDEGAKR